MRESGNFSVRELGGRGGGSKLFKTMAKGDGRKAGFNDTATSYS